ncbi:MAG: hypothetical protein A2Y95_03040 [Deltaproteobacteria bacterium RBG_13_65_10]|nr:MAG: hypothetical protein A2Y95_03040 [Deltaproteobacteria bacterium RBG_13_65_10]
MLPGGKQNAGAEQELPPPVALAKVVQNRIGRARLLVRLYPQNASYRTVFSGGRGSCRASSKRTRATERL